jgi:hypothetical protein
MKMLGLGFHHYPNIYYRTSKLNRLKDVSLSRFSLPVLR